MAMWAGADMDQIVAGDVFPGQTITGRNMHPDDPFYALYMDWWWCPAVASMPMLYVDIAGYRYANENLPFQQNAVAALGMPEGRAWALWDGAWQTKFPMIPEKTPASRNTPEQLEIDLKEGITVKADTLEALAALIDMPVENLLATVARYNELCAKGHDDDCLKEPAWMQPLDTPPFYAAGIGAAITGTRGGVKINADMQVLDKKGRVDPGAVRGGQQRRQLLRDGVSAADRRKRHRPRLHVRVPAAIARGGGVAAVSRGNVAHDYRHHRHRRRRAPARRGRVRHGLPGAARQPHRVRHAHRLGLGARLGGLVDGGGRRGASSRSSASPPALS